MEFNNAGELFDYLKTQGFVDIKSTDERLAHQTRWRYNIGERNIAFYCDYIDAKWVNVMIDYKRLSPSVDGADQFTLLNTSEKADAFLAEHCKPYDWKEHLLANGFDDRYLSIDNNLSSDEMFIEIKNDNFAEVSVRGMYLDAIVCQIKPTRDKINAIIEINKQLSILNKEE